MELVNLFIRYCNSCGICFLKNLYIGNSIFEFITLSLVVGAIAELSHTEANIERIKTEDGLVPLIRLINTNGPELLVNVSRALGECANNKDALERMRRQDGVRLLWSLLKHSSEQVQVCIMAGLCVLSLSGQAFYHVWWLHCAS